MPDIPRNLMSGQVTTRLGRVSLNPRGSYDAEQTYGRLDLVEYNGSGYVCLQESVKGQTPESGENWMRLADNGGAATVAAAQEYANQAKNSQDEAKKSETAAQTAQTAAESAKTDAETARDAAASSAASATQQASAAESSATAASGSADAASASETAAQTAKTEAEAARDAAKGYQDAAGTSATAAASSAEAASGSATAAEGSATEAAESAEAASASKTAAASSAEAAETAKDTAVTAGAAATQSAEDAAASAETAQQYSGKPPIIQGNHWWTWNAEEQDYTDTGKKAVLNYDKTYASYAEMEADKGNQPENTLAIISSDVEDPYNAQLYIMGADSQWRYLADLSGLTGVGIETWEKTAGTGAAGTTDTYTLTLTDGQEFTYTVYNGADGLGAGDMLKSVYDKGNKSQDIFDYVDEVVKNVTIEMDETPTESSENAVKSGGIYTALQDKADLGEDGKVEAEQLPEHLIVGEAPALPGVLLKLDADTLEHHSADYFAVKEDTTAALDGKQDKLTFDKEPTAGSENPVESQGIHAALEQMKEKLDLKADKAELAVQSNPNLLDDWYFADPINQRGQEEYTASTYSIDRWLAGEVLRLKIEPKVGISISAPAISNLMQRTGVLYIGTTLTASILTTDNVLYSVTGTTNSTGETGNVCNIVCDGFNLGIHNYGGNQNIGIYITKTEYTKPISFLAAKLELGNVQTLAHQDENGKWVLSDRLPNRQFELLKCMAYYEVSDAPVTLQGNESKTIPFRQYKRANPTIEISYVGENGLTVSTSAVTTSSFKVTNNNDSPVTFNWAADANL